MLIARSHADPSTSLVRDLPSPFSHCAASRIDDDGIIISLSMMDGVGVKIALMLAIHVSNHQRFATSPGN